MIDECRVDGVTDFGCTNSGDDFGIGVERGEKVGDRGIVVAGALEVDALESVNKRLNKKAKLY